MGRIDLEKLIVFGNVRTDAVAAKAALIYGALYSEDSAFSASDEQIRAYYDVQRELLSSGYPATGISRSAPTCWKGYVLKLIAESENAFTLSSERGEFNRDLVALAAVEMPTLRALYELDWDRVASVCGGNASCVASVRPSADAFEDSDEFRSASDELDGILRMPDAGAAASSLAEYYAREACDIRRLRGFQVGARSCGRGAPGRGQL
jgi:hypothetical protein